MTGTSDEIHVSQGMYENHTHGPWIAEGRHGSIRITARGHTEEEARAALRRALERVR